VKINKGYQGYTLIEVLAALFIFIILVSMVSFSFIRMLKNTELIKAKEERLVDVQMALVTLQFDLSQAIDKQMIINKNDLQGSFYTRNNALHFYKMGNINPEEQFNRSSIEEVEYKIIDGDLIKRIKEDDTSKPINQILLRGVTSMEWRFIDSKFSTYSLWPPTQDWQFKIPSAVNLTLTLKDMGPIEKMIELANHD
jgi:general secretion pathway protein J